MKRSGWLTSALWVLAVQGAATAACAASADEDQIRALQAKVAAAISAKDVDAIMTGYAPDVYVFDVVPPRAYVGKAAWRADWAGVIKNTPGPMSLTVEDLAVSADGEIGYSHAIDHYVNTLADGSKADMLIRASDVYRKIDGRWLIVEEHLSVPVDLATGKPDLLSKP
jgi:uncharacterized protein (TIGR02246 family)